MITIRSLTDFFDVDVAITKYDVLNNLLYKWLNSFESKETKRHYKLGVELFFNTPIENITYDMIISVSVFDIECYIDKLIKDNKKSNTIKSHLFACSSLYNYLLGFQSNKYDVQIIKYNPFKNGIIKNAVSRKLTKNDVKIKEVLTNDELIKIYNAINKEEIIGVRDYAIIKTMLNGGALRRSELINLRIKDIKLLNNDEFWLHVEKGKGNKNRDNFINNETVGNIENYLNMTGRSLADNTDDYIFKGLSTNGLNNDKLTSDAIKQIIDKYCKLAKINKKISPHSLRHTVVTTLIDKGINIELVKEYCGHTSIKTTDNYWHNIDKIKNNAGKSFSL